MIHKLIISVLGMLFTTAVSAQLCDTDTTLSYPGYKPDSLPSAAMDVAYSQSITVRTIRDTTTVFGGNTVSVTIDSVRVRNVLGMPPGFTYQCLNPGCIFLPLTNSCVLLSGTSGQPGVYPIKIAVLGYARVAGSIKVQQPDTITRFSIVVTGTSGFSVLDQPGSLKLFPNPASESLYVTGLGNGLPEFFDLNARKLNIPLSAAGDSRQQTPGTAKFDLAGLSKGVYLISYNGHVERFVKN